MAVWFPDGYITSSERTYSGVAQLVEQVAVNHLVAGSSPAAGAIFFLLIVFMIC